MFADYISHILPELGEENIREMSFDLFAYRELQDVAADCEDKYDQIERAVKIPDTWKQYREKQSPEYVSRLQGFMMSLEDELMNFRDVEYKAAPSGNPKSSGCFISGFRIFLCYPEWKLWQNILSIRWKH